MKVKFLKYYFKLTFVLYALASLFIDSTAYSQTFFNGDLEAEGQDISATPDGWDMVPFTDPFCQATSWAQATPDICEGSILFGAGGFPYSGVTYSAGAHGFFAGQGYLWHEGIMQTVNGFVIDSFYVIGLHQCTDLTNGNKDSSGSWAILVDDLLIEFTEATKSTIPINDLNLEWEKREVVFKATLNTHTIKFLPIDDDPLIFSESIGDSGSVYMGIDSVYLTPYHCNQQLNLGEDLIQCEGDTVILDATTLNASYLWNDGSDYRKLTVTETGYYSVQATVYNCPVIDSMALFDTVFVEFIPYPIVDLGEDTLFVCYNESAVLDAFAENASYLWQDSSTYSTYTVTQPDLYSVDVLRSICLFKDSINVAFQFCVSQIEMPNVFSPNGDNVNDVFSPVKLEGIINLHTTMRNRWGQIVFVSDDLLLKWDGRDMMGKNVSDGVYFWQIEYEDEGHKKDKIDGFLTLCR